MEQRRTVWTEYGQLDYILARKQIKNMNLRITNAGEVCLSVPIRCSQAQSDLFVISKSRWIRMHLAGKEKKKELFPVLDRQACYALLELSLDRVYPLIEPYGIVRPRLKIRKMRSQWGNCHWMQGYITLNTALCQCPESLRDYVALHELVHFVHHDHGSGFYLLMDKLMPDWKTRRQELKGYYISVRN